MSVNVDQSAEAEIASARQSLTAGSNPSRAILFLSVAAFASAGTTRVMDAILPQLALEFGVTIGAVAFVATSYAFTYGAFQLVAGPLGDRYGKYRVILLACVGSAITTYICAWSGSIAEIATARFASGMTAAAIVPLSIAWLGDVVASTERQHVLARFLSGQILGLLAGQIGGGVIGEYFGWRSAFLLIGTIYLLALAGLTFEMIRNPSTRVSEHENDASFWRTWATLIGLTSRPVVRFVLAMVAVEAFAMFGAFTYLGANMRSRFGFDFATIGLYLACYCIGGLFYVSQSRRLIAVLGPTRLAATGTLIVATAYAAIALIPISWVYPPAIAVMGLGFYMLHNTLQTFATQMAPDARGSAVAIFATSYFLAQAIGVFMAGVVIDRYGTTPVFLLAAAILLGLGLLLLRLTPSELTEA